MNKKLFTDNNNLSKSIDVMTHDLNDLENRIEELIKQNERLREDKSNLERNIQNLNNNNTSQKVEITKLIEDNQKLSKMCSDQDRNIKNNDMDKSRLVSKNDELGLELKNLQGRLQAREDNISFLSKQLDEAKMHTNRLGMNLREAEKDFEGLKADNQDLSHMLGREKAGRIDAEKACDRLNMILGEKDKELSKNNKEIDSYKRDLMRSNDENMFLNNELDKLRNHIIILTENNQKVSLII